MSWFDEQDNNPADPEQAGYEPHTSVDTEPWAEYIPNVVSNCCSAPVIDNFDICSDCKEHCEGVPEE